MLRLFVGIEFPPELKLRLSLLQNGVADAKWVDPGNFHLTLRFIGEVDEGTAADVDEALARLKARPFSLQLYGVGVFGGDKPRQLWVGVEREPALAALQAKIEQALIRVGLPPEPRKFAPHVTLGRLRVARRDDIQRFLADHAQFRAEPLRIDRFSLIASYPTKAGSVYEDQADYKLQG
jgi:RNA 2',3'-cyclic 3'-phosphodiesterase